MRSNVNSAKLREFMQVVGNRATTRGIVYFTGGATALLLGIRSQTIDIDIKLDPEPGGVFEAISELKDSLDVNVELASPDLFIPPLPGWRERSQSIASLGKVEFRHFDFYSQALSKIERGLNHDLADVRSLVEMNLIETPELMRLAVAIQPDLIRYPAINSQEFQHKIVSFVEGQHENRDR